ncbi:MAG TPA: HprK-related kinase A [Myxococcota bacterium]|nr:HprK-related kinase A [Myxococcota bacterium]
MRLAELAPGELEDRLAQGLGLVTGPFRFLIQSRQPRVVEGLRTLYGDFEIGEYDFYDFHVRLARPLGLRRWFRPQINFWLDDHAPFKPLPADHDFAQLEWGMNWCIAGHAHHYLMLHAAVLEKNGQALIMPGEPGAGKSTLTALLTLSGWRLLSDEITLIDRQDGSLLPLARPVSLKNASIDVVRGFVPSAFIGEAARDTHKGTVAHLRPPTDSVMRMDERARARHIVFPRWRRGAPPTTTPHSKADAFIQVASHAFNYDLLGELGFRLTTRLLDECACRNFEYSQPADALAFFESLVA